jgi:hypothetical protein
LDILSHKSKNKPCLLKKENITETVVVAPIRKIMVTTIHSDQDESFHEVSRDDEISDL